VSIASDLTVNATYTGQTSQKRSLGTGITLAIADCKLQGAATSPTSTSHFIITAKNKTVKLFKELSREIYELIKGMERGFSRI